MTEDSHLPQPAGSDDGMLRDVLAKTTAAALAVSSAEPGRVFEDLAHALARILAVDAALIAEFVDPGRTRMRSLAAVLNGKTLRPFEYEVALTPCRHIVGRASRFVAAGVNPEFKPGTVFAALGFDSYAGYSLLGTGGEQLGIVVALDRKPIVDRELTEALLKIFAVRAAAEIERGRAEASYRAIFDAAEDAVFIHDWETGSIVDVNDKAAQVYGYTRDEMRTLRVADFSSGEPPYTERHARELINRAKGGEPVRFEWHRRNRDGSLHWDEVCLKAATIAGRPHILAFTREITERKAALEALQQREEQYRAIFNASADALVLWSPDLRIVDVNPAFLRIYGFTREQIVGQGYPAHFPRDYVGARLELVRRALAGDVCELQTRAYRADGTPFDVELRVIPIRHRGEPHVLAIARDITERRAREEALRASEEQYRTIFNASADALVLWDSNYKRVDVNPAYERIFGWTRAEVVGSDYGERNVPPDYAERRLDLVRRALAGELCHAELESIRKDGERFRAEIHVIPIQYRGAPHALAIARDITERHRADEERARLEAQLRQAQKMEAIGQLTGGIAHDFNNILASIMGYVVLAEERAQDADDEKTTGYLEHALDACRRARDLIQQMLTFSRGRRGEPRPVKLCELVRDATPLLRSSMPSTIALDFDCDRSAPPVLADEIQAGQVLLNLAINARDAIGTTGTLRIGVRSTRASGLVCTSCRHTVDGSFVELAVADDGCGIEPAVVDRIFEPFFSTKDTGKGSGMGLSMVHGIVHEHGGHVVVETAAGRGSVFRVLLPALLGDDGVASAEPAARHPAKARKLRGRVLLVDDEDSVRNVMQERLRTWGLDVEAASDAATARAAFDAAGGSIDAVITDQTMPHETGLDLARALRSRRADLPVILYTGYADELTAAQAQAAGVRLLLRKPVEPAELRAALERVLPAE
jgi:PAS domain S-box-containing protein